eukprot:3031620-Pleurochrysis_carterae.AAC.1
MYKRASFILSRREQISQSVCRMHLHGSGRCGAWTPVPLRLSPRLAPLLWRLADGDPLAHVDSMMRLFLRLADAEHRAERLLEPDRLDQVAALIAERLVDGGHRAGWLARPVQAGRKSVSARGNVALRWRTKPTSVGQ